MHTCTHAAEDAERHPLSSKQRGNLRGLGRPAKQEALRRIAAQGAEEGELGRRLHALRHHLFAEGVSHGDDRPHHRLVLRVAANVPHE